MSRALSAIEDLPNLSLFDREAALMDESRVSYELPPDDGGGGGDSLYNGQIVRHFGTGDRYVVIRGYLPGRGHGFHLAPVSNGRADPSRAVSPRGTWVNELGQALEVGGSGQITGSRSLPQDWWLGEAGGGTGSTGSAYHPPAWKPGEQAMEQEALDLRRQETAQRIEEINLQAQHDRDAAIAAHDNAIALLEMEMEHASEMQAERIQAEIGLANLRHENNMAELEERIEADKKMVIYGEIGATGRTMLQEQGAMGRELLQLGPDPLGQAAGLAGQVTRGITPQQQAVGQAQSFMAQPIPQANMGMSLPQLEGMLGGMPSGQRPMAGGFGMAGPLGMARGGTVKTKKGKQQSVIVGEAGKEIVTGSDFKVTPLAGGAQFGARIGGIGTQIGKTAGGPDTAPPSPPGRPDLPTSGGLRWRDYFDQPAYELPWEDPNFRSPHLGWRWQQPPLPPGMGPIAYTRELQPPQGWYEQIERPFMQSIFQGLAPMFAGSPFGRVPTTGGGTAAAAPRQEQGWVPPDSDRPIKFSALGLPAGHGLSPMGIASQLGVTPQLIRTYAVSGEPGLDPNNPNLYGHTYFVQGGQRQFIPGGNDPDVLRSMGFDPGQVVLVAPSDVRRYTQGASITEAPPITTDTRQGYGALGSPLIEATTGAALMSPHKIAGLWGQMTPAQQQVALSAYQHAGGPTGFGLGQNTVLDMIQAFTPAGRGYGRRIGGIGQQF